MHGGIYLSNHTIVATATHSGWFIFMLICSKALCTMSKAKTRLHTEKRAKEDVYLLVYSFKVPTRENALVCCTSDTVSSPLCKMQDVNMPLA